MADEANMFDTLVDDTGTTHSEDARRAWLICIGSPEDDFLDAGRIFPLDGIANVRFGRGSGELVEKTREGKLDLSIPLGWVSGQHAELRIQRLMGKLTFELEDLDSRNGTIVENVRVKGRRRLEPGEVFEIGRSFWMVRELGLRRLRRQGLDDLDAAGTCNPRTHQLHRTLHRLAPTSIPILLHGETGTGKGHLAEALHRLSGRAGPLVRANLAATSPERAEAALFGSSDRPGLFEEADGGTLVLDELDELTDTAQLRLLAAVDQGRAARVGEADARTFDVRVISRTLGDPQELARSGNIRPDLYSRLAGFVAEVPPLRRRREDLGLLTRSFLGPTPAGDGRVRLETAAFRRLMGHRWPFNVREYAHTLRTASMLATNQDAVTLAAIEEVLWTPEEEVSDPNSLRELREELVRELVRSKGQTDKAARAMGRDPAEVERWLERFAIEPDTYTDRPRN